MPMLSLLGWGIASKLRGDSVLRLPATSPRASLSGKGWRTHYRGAELTMLIPQRRRDAARNGWRVPPEKTKLQVPGGQHGSAVNSKMEGAPSPPTNFWCSHRHCSGRGAALRLASRVWQIVGSYPLEYAF